MNDTLVKALGKYSLATHQAYACYMYGLSKDTVISLFTDLLTTYINDKNSSTLREFITVSVAGYNHNDSKIGFNGYKHNSLGEAVACEAKPKNIHSSDHEEYLQGKRKSIRKLNGSGNFTDYTWGRFNKDKSENLNMLVSGFINGKLFYVLEFPFADERFTAKLEKQLQRHFPNGDIPGRFLRSANFDYRDFMTSKSLRVVYCNESTIDTYKQYFVGGFFNALREKIAIK